MELMQLKGGNARMENGNVKEEGKLERIMLDLKPRIETDSPINRQELLVQRPYELSSSPDYTDWG